MKHLIIVNPVAGNKRNVVYAKRIQKLLKKNNISAEIFVSEFKGHITKYLKELDLNSDYRIYSVGGDGTLNEVVNGLTDKKTQIVVVPCGTGNDYIKSIGKYKSMRKVILESMNNNIICTDSILIKNNLSCINILSVGFDALIAKNLDKFRWVPFVSGKFKYNLSILYTLFSSSKFKLKIRINDTIIKKGYFTLVAIANGKYYGGGIIPCPDAKVDDQKLDVCVVKSTNLFEKIVLLPKYKKGKHTSLKQCEFIKAEKISIVSTRKFPANIDGEVFLTNKLNILINKNSNYFLKT